MSRYRIPLFAALAVAALLASSRAEAIPAFARKYQISCSACHAPIPRLTAFGEEFAARGFRMDDPSKEPASQADDLGDPLLELPKNLPLSIRLEGYGSWKQDQVAETDAEWPWVFKLISGGPIADKISYFLYFLAEQQEVVGLEDAWVQFDSVFRLPVDLTVGQFQVCDPMFKRELRLERFDYDIFESHVGKVGVDLTYDRGVIGTWHAPRKVDAIFQVVNGNGIGAASDGQFDKDNYKNVALRIVRPFGKARVGLFGYWGRERGPDAAGTGPTNRTTYFGPDLVLDLGPHWQFSAEYLERRDDDPRFEGGDGPSYRTRGGFAELHFFPGGPDGRWVLSALYNRVTSDFAPVAEDEADPRSETVSLTAGYLLARNVRCVIEGGRDLENDASRFSVGLVAAF
jgi:hypothetical protein